MPIMHLVTSSQERSPREGSRIRLPFRGRIARYKERGATILEFALVSVLLFGLIFLIVEGAFAVRARNTMSNAIDDAARRGAIAASAPNADYQILFQLFGRGANSVADVEYVSIYRSTNGSGDVPQNCADGNAQSGAQACNVYRAADMFDSNGAFITDQAYFTCETAGAHPWCSLSRGLDPKTLEFIGVYVKANYRLVLVDAFYNDFTVNVSGGSLQAIETSGEETTP